MYFIAVFAYRKVKGHMKNKIWKISIFAIILFFIVLLLLLNWGDLGTKEGTWNEAHTVYTNGNGVKINQEEYDDLLSQYGSQKEIDSFNEDMVDASFYIGIKVEGQEYWSGLEEHIHELPNGFEKIGEIQALSKFRFGVMDQMKDFEATSNMRFISEVGKGVYYSKDHAETVLIEGSEGSYYIFTLEGKETTIEDVHTGTHE